MVLAVALNVGWILLNWRQVALLVLGIIFFVAIIAGLVLNTIFLVREIRRNEQHDAFINAVTHELKTPIASIRLYLETLRSRSVSEQKRDEFYGIMMDDTDRLLGTVEQVLSAGRVGQRKRNIHVTGLDIGELLNECVTLARKRYRIEESSLTYSENLPAGLRPFVRGDREELRVALSNLIENAIKYSEDKMNVKVSVSAANKGFEVRVQDMGVGIPPAQLKRIFKRFYRVPGQMMARVKGTGLGLFIVQSIVERHGGKVKAESEGEGSGSTFTIFLPRNKGAFNG